MSGKVRDYTKLAKDILDAVGGEENVVGVTHCATRLDLTVYVLGQELFKIVR